MPHRDLVVIGASAGGLRPLTTILEGLPATVRACVLIVMHTRPDADGQLPQILARHSALPVAFARDKSGLKPGRVYVARPDFHLLVARNHSRLSHGPREHGFRPAIDPLFRTAARAFGPRVVGVILSGALDDGMSGLGDVKSFNGVTIVQDPADAIIPTMPSSAIAHVDVDYVLPAAAIAPMIVRLSDDAAVTTSRSRQGAEEMDRSTPIKTSSSTVSEVGDMEKRYGPPSSLTCPECGGALWEIQEGQVLRYQCHTGHRYAPDSLQASQSEAVELALWRAVRVLEEQSEFKMRMARRTADEGLGTLSSEFEQAAQQAHAHAQEIRKVLSSPPQNSASTDAPFRQTVQAAVAATRSAKGRTLKPPSRSAKRKARGRKSKR
jgi:two-component system chemotaxis response regulator CheB